MTSEPYVPSSAMDSPDDYLTELLRSRAAEEPSVDRSRAIRSECTDDLKPVRRVPVRHRVLISLCLAVALTLVFALMSGYQLMGAAAAAIYGVVAWALVQLGVLVAGFGAAHKLPPLGKAVIVVLVPAAFFFCLSMIGAHSPFGEFVAHSDHSRDVIKCGGFALSAGIIAALGIMLVWRRTDPFDPGFSGSVAGLVGGLAGALGVGLVCRDHGSWHLWLGHGMSVIALIVVGRLLGRRFLAP